LNRGAERGFCFGGAPGGARGLRAEVTARINAVLGTAYVVQVCALAEKGF